MALNLVKDAQYEQAILKQRRMKADEQVEITSFVETAECCVVSVWNGQESDSMMWTADADSEIDRLLEMYSLKGTKQKPTADLTSSQREILDEVEATVKMWQSQDETQKTSFL